MSATSREEPGELEHGRWVYGGAEIPQGRSSARNNGGGVAAGIVRGTEGLDFLDAPNLTTMLFHANGGNAQAAVSSIDLVTLRASLIARYGGRRSYYVVTAYSGRDRTAHRKYVERCQWKFVEASCPSASNRDPADVFIIEGILAATSQLALTGSRTIVLISHDGGFADVCRGFLNGGGRVVIVGFRGSFSTKLCDLAVHPSCEILDLRQDLGAVPPTPSGPLA